MSSKKKEKGKKKGEKSKKEPKEAPEPVLERVDETSKQFFLLQIKDLEEKLTRYQKKSDELEILCKKYEGEYESLSNDKKDIISNLKKELERKADEILDLNDRLVGLQQAKDAEKEAFEKQLTDLRTEYQETKDNLTNQNNTLLAKLAALDEFRTQKEDLLAKLAELEQKIDLLEKEHQEKLYDIEKKVVLDKDRLKKDMIVRVNQVAADFRRVSNKQMADTTKRTIRENVSINAQLQKMSEKIIEIVDNNEKLARNDKETKQQIDILEDNEKKLAKKNVSNIKILRMLTDKCKSQEVIIAELEEKFNEMQESEAKSAELAEQLGRITESLKNANDENEELRKLVRELKHDAETFQNYRNKIEKTLKEATHSLILALSKNASLAKKASLKNIKTENNIEEEWNDIDIRDNMLENLLILLNSAATLGFGPELQDFSSQGYHRPKSTEFPGSGKGLRKNQVPLTKIGHSSSGINPHYDLGDLGVVPRKEEHILTNIEKMKIIHPQRELGTLQKVTRKSVSTQTLDTTKASVFTKFELSEEKTEDNFSHPFFENTNKKGPSKTQILHPLTATNRVTNKVF